MSTSTKIKYWIIAHDGREWTELREKGLITEPWALRMDIANAMSNRDWSEFFYNWRESALKEVAQNLADEVCWHYAADDDKVWKCDDCCVSSTAWKKTHAMPVYLPF